MIKPGDLFRPKGYREKVRGKRLASGGYEYVDKWFVISEVYYDTYTIRSGQNYFAIEAIEIKPRAEEE